MHFVRVYFLWGGLNCNGITYNLPQQVLRVITEKNFFFLEKVMMGRYNANANNLLDTASFWCILENPIT